MLILHMLETQLAGGSTAAITWAYILHRVPVIVSRWRDGQSLEKDHVFGQVQHRRQR
jgi:hypothetical protein